MLYPIRASSVAYTFMLLLYSLTLGATLVFINLLWLKILLSLLLVLFLITDLQRHIAALRDDPMVLTLHDKSGKIEMKQSRHKIKYSQFILFANRWFLILQLKNNRSRKNLLLMPDRFQSIHEYLKFRYAIMNMSRN